MIVIGLFHLETFFTHSSQETGQAIQPINHNLFSRVFSIKATTDL